MIRRSVLFLLLSSVFALPAMAQDIDTDDDGFRDVDEVYSAVKCGGRAITHTNYSRSPLIQRSLSLSAPATGLSVIDSNRFDLADWTVECWVYPTAATQTVTLVKRLTQLAGETTFRLHLAAGIPVVEFSRSGRRYQAGGSGINSAIPTGTWTHVAGVWDSGTDSLSLYVNGSAEQSVWVLDNCARGEGKTTVGIGFSGNLDDLRIWDRSRTGNEIDAGRWRFGVGSLYNDGQGGSAEGLVAYYPFDDGGTTFEDFTHLTNWTYAIATNVSAMADSNTFVNLGGLLDDDVDDIPDWWEAMFAAGDADPGTSLDADSLNNLYEYYCDTNPNFVDTDNDGTRDDDEDSDRDGLWNGDEQVHGSDPRLPDTDDDGVGDRDEQVAGTDPTDSLDPFAWRALSIAGNAASYMEMPPGNRFALGEWTIEAWVQPAGTWSASGDICVREVEPGVANYSLSVDASGFPVVSFGANAVTGTAAIAADGETWTHLAATYDGSTRVLSILVDGELDASVIAGTRPRTSGVGPITQRVGQGFEGLISELRLWDEAIDAGTVASRMDLPLSGNESDLVAYYRFDDGTSFEDGVQGTSREAAWDYGQVEDFVATYPADWLVAWGSAGSLRGAVLTNLVSTQVPFDGDSDGDGMPDGWEIGHGLDPDDRSDATEDPDGDGLNNLYEFLCETDPNDPNTDGDSLDDGEEDYDTDGLVNEDEQQAGSHPQLQDTDDDGLNDNTEVTNGLAPIDSLDPFGWGALSLPGAAGSYVELPDDPRLALADWTLELWVRPDIGETSGTLIRREVESGVTNYELSLDALRRPVIGFGSVVLAGSGSVVADGETWTHIAATYDSSANRVRLFVDGVQVASQMSALDPVTEGDGPLEQRVGEDFDGLIDDVRIWNTARSESAIADASAYALTGSESGLVLYHRFDDGTSYESGVTGTSLVPAWMTGQVEEFAAGHAQDWLTAWANAGTLVGSADLVPLLWSEIPLDDDRDNDGMPDTWEQINGLDPTDPSDADDDPDGDDLSNLYEYYCMTDPNNSNTDGNLLPDGMEDFDFDGLVNMYEEDEGTDPRLPDTDDDGEVDLAELNSGHSPINSLSPLYWRALSFAGNPGCYVDLPLQSRFALGEWTVEAWIRPDSGASGAATILRREASPGETNYVLAINASMRPTAGFSDTMVTSPDAIVADGDTWTHLAATYDAGSQRLRLFVDGTQVASRLAILSPPSSDDAGSLHRLGESFDGLIDEARIWDSARSGSAILTESQQVLSGSEAGLVAYYRADDGTAFELGISGTSLEPSWTSGQVEDFAASQSQDWLTGWQSAGSLMGGCVFEDLALLDLPIDSDSDNDGMPDIWEIVNGLDPSDPSDATEDPDGDGLVNLYEYYCETDPNNTDTDGDDTPDDQEDYDLDGLLNIEEQDAGSDPRLPDTDDDGIDDEAEVDGGLDPLSSLVPLTWRALDLPGSASSYVEMPDESRFALTDWSIEAWVLPTNTWSQYGSILTRTSEPGITNYFLALDASLRPTAGFGDQVLTGAAVLAADGATWSHLAATFDATTRQLNLYVNGESVGTRTCTAGPVAVGSGPTEQRVGEGFAGLLDETRLWGVERSQSDLDTYKSTVLDGTETGLVVYYRFDDGTSYESGVSGTSLVSGWDRGQVEDFADGDAADWLVQWANAGTLSGSAALTALIWSDTALGEDADGDGMPDAWEIEHGLDPFDSSDADEDPDGDGLTNLYEYYSDTDPNDRDTDDDGEWDGAEDRDDDGLENQDEQAHGTDPRLPDTDDDGLSDLDEKLAATDPADSLDPLTWRALSLPGNSSSYAEMPESERFELMDWTVEVWVQPSDTWLGDGILVHRDIEPGETNFFLAVDGTLAPVAGFGENAVTSDTAIAADSSTWTHIAATYTMDGQWLRLYVNGEETASRICSANPRFAGLGPIVQRIGVDVSGLIDEVRVWDVPRTQRELQSTMDVILTGGEIGLVAHYRFDDGTSFVSGSSGTSGIDAWSHGQVEDFVDGLERNWEELWADAATLNGGALYSDDGEGAPVLPPQSLRITLEPDTVGTGAQWRVWLDDEWSEWRDSGEIVLDLSPGAHTTEYADVGAWIQPSNELVTVTTTAAVNIVRYYAFLIGESGKETGEFIYPRGLAVYDDYVYIADSANHRIQRIDAAATNLDWRVLGEFGTGSGEFNQPFGLAVATNGDLFVADGKNNRIQWRDADSGSWSTWGGTAPGTGVGSFNGPFDVAVDTNDNLYVADHYNHRIQKRTPGGSWSVIVDSGFDEDQARHPNGVEIDPDGNLIVGDHDGIGGRSRIRRFTTEGDFIERIAGSDDDEGDVWRPMHMTFSAGGALFVADSGQDRAIHYGGTAFDWSEVTTPGFLNTPWSVAIDRHDRLYIADTGNNRVLRLDLDTAAVPMVRRAEVSETASTFKWVGKAGWVYTVEFTDDLAGGQWEALPGYEHIMSEGGVMTCVDADAPALSQRFYRIHAK